LRTFACKEKEKDRKGKGQEVKEEGRECEVRRGGPE